MTADWTPIFVLPDIPLEAAIGCDIAALAPAHDRRVAALKRMHPTFRRFLNRFADNFGQKFKPSVLILNTAAPPIFRDITALASFRDLIALATVTHGRALELRHPRGHRVVFGEARFAAAQVAGKFADEIVPVEVRERGKPLPFQKDERNRPDTTLCD